MIKRILVALDPDDDTPIATQYAIRLGSRFNASLTGLAVVDIGDIYTGTGGGYGAIFYPVELWEELSDNTRAKAGELLDQFKHAVEKAGVNYTAIKKQGVSEEHIIEHMKYHDLLIIGRDSHFFYDQPQRKTDTLAQVVKGGVAPTLVVTDEYRDIEKIMIAFDGSAAAARSLKDFVHLLPYGKDLEIDLVNVAADEKEEDLNISDFLLGEAETYLKTHNFSYIQKTILKKGSPAERIFEQQQKKDPDMILLGAHAVSAIRRATFGSTTHELITRSEIPLFLSP